MTCSGEIDTVGEHLERYRAVSLQALDLVPDSLGIKIFAPLFSPLTNRLSKNQCAWRARQGH